jgi:crotonobetainyl-CoA:carnitine CoA-transferase CaiB-like acyl-CoA transferase
MFESMAQFVLADHIGGGAFVPSEGPMGYRRLLSRTRGPYATRDGHLALVVYTDRHWRSFTALVGCPELLDVDPRFQSQESRTLNAEDVGRFLADHLPARGNREWLDLLHGIDIPACPVNAIEDLFDDPHLQASGGLAATTLPGGHTTRLPILPLELSGGRATAAHMLPGAGEHTAAILATLGVGAAELAALEDEHVI